MAGPTVLVEAPPREPRQGGIKSVATFVNEVRLGATQAVVYISDGCTFPQLDQHLCYTGDPTPDPKTSVGVDTLVAAVEPFALYAGVECYLGPNTDYDERARRILDQGEDRPLETALEEWADGGTALATGATLVDRIANVDNALDAGYLGQGVILMNRGDAVRADAQGALEWGVDGIPRTINHTPVLASSSFPVGVVLGVGAITIVRTGIETYTAQEFVKNREWSIGEAVYSIIIDCNFRVLSGPAA